jgi:hypothetical protein
MPGVETPSNLPITLSDSAPQRISYNARRSADYAARAIVRELKNEGLVMNQPGRRDGRSWEDFVESQPKASRRRE